MSICEPHETKPNCYNCVSIYFYMHLHICIVLEDRLSINFMKKEFLK